MIIYLMIGIAVLLTFLCFATEIEEATRNRHSRSSATNRNK